MPSPRNIELVSDSWSELPYDKYIVKNRLEKEAYQNGRDFFLEYDEYTHLVICPDDIVIDYDSFELLKRDMEEYEFSNLCGVGMLDENSNAYCCKPFGVPFNQVSSGSYYYKETDRGYPLLPKKIFECGYSGFMIQWLERSLVEKLSFDGGCNNGEGCMDVKMSEEFKEMGESFIIEPNANFTHLRNAQKKQLKEWMKNGDHKGYTIYMGKQG